jgi:cytochrome bd-type quinol oxidase subunit 1
MPTQVPTTTEPGLASLVRGIVNDIGDLVKQQMQFARAEIKADLRKSREAIAFLAIGAGSAFVGVLFFGLMVVHLLHWLTLPGGDAAYLPLWICHAIVAALFLVIGACLLSVGRKMLTPSNVLPVQTIETAKENVEWITNSK